MSNKSIHIIKTEIIDSAKGNRGYLVPFGFLTEPYDTFLHRALRELAAECKIQRSGSDHSFERWVAVRYVA